MYSVSADWPDALCGREIPVSNRAPVNNRRPGLRGEKKESGTTGCQDGLCVPLIDVY